MEEKCYFLVKDSMHNRELVIVNYESIEGFHVKPRNRIKYDGITVNQMTIIKPSFIKKVLKRKVQRKLDLYLQFIINLLETNEEDSDPSALASALNDLNRYRSIVNGNYRRFLEEKYIELLLKKIALLEQEIKKRLMHIEMEQYKRDQISKEKEEEKARKSR